MLRILLKKNSLEKLNSHTPKFQISSAEFFNKSRKYNLNFPAFI